MSNKGFLCDDGIRKLMLISGFGGNDSDGLFMFDGNHIERLDTADSRGLYADNSLFGRMLLRQSERGDVGDICIVDSDGMVTYHKTEKIVGPHDLTWDGNVFLAVSAHTNSIMSLSNGGKIETFWRAPGEDNSWHLNCLVFHNNQLLVSAFGKFYKKKGWEAHKHNGTGVIYNINQQRDELNGLCCPHHPRYIDDSLIVCNSAEQSLIRVNTTTGTITHSVILNGWTRGVTCSSDFIFVGESPHKYSYTSGATATVALICRRTLKLVDRFSILSKQIYDLVMVPVNLAHSVRRELDHLTMNDARKYSKY